MKSISASGEGQREGEGWCMNAGSEVHMVRKMVSLLWVQCAWSAEVSLESWQLSIWVPAS